MEEGEYESVLCVKPEVHVYRIPPRATNRGYRGALCSGPSGSVSRHSCGERDGFQQVLRYPHRRWKRWVKQQCEFAKQAENPDQGPKLDLSFKEGQTIKLNIANMKKKEGAAGPPRARPASTGGLSLLPPPPGGKTSTLIPPPGEQLSVAASIVQPAVAPSSDLETSIGGATVSWPQPKPAATATADIWGDFTKSTGYLKSPTPPYLTFPGPPPARLSQAQAGSSSDLSTTPFLHTTSGKELPHLGRRKEDEALPGQPLFGA
ncbi:adaptin ear-binding coat-associated protein 2 isoform X3 [Tursiops truncatus]|uniref:Adaptin ear-binding coat-associated protein 2 isoform X3 n=1 Tax=Tursiops truncatus TaxID=9739 RepID=A0A6J3Q8A5_TURTR|nr:adaptin ear-binding coat-associated protein 2 isoform X3 [Tursiops truncatus]